LKLWKSLFYFFSLPVLIERFFKQDEDMWANIYTYCPKDNINLVIRKYRFKWMKYIGHLWRAGREYGLCVVLNCYNSDLNFCCILVCTVLLLICFNWVFWLVFLLLRLCRELVYVSWYSWIDDYLFSLGFDKSLSESTFCVKSKGVETLVI